MTIDDFIQTSSTQLAHVGIPTPRLDVLVLLSSTLQRDKSWLFAHGSELLLPEQLTDLRAQLKRRAQREPLAYILGEKEFYGRRFEVTPAVLVPRPETEALIEVLLDLPLARDARVIDVGTGSGAIAITIALERPGFRVYATDISHNALRVARSNASLYRLTDITFYDGNLLEAAPEGAKFDVVAANLPYVDPSWDHSPEIEHEPRIALFANDGGIELIKKLISQASSHLHTGSYMLLEADPEQHTPITAYARENGFDHVRTDGYIVTLQLA